MRVEGRPWQVRNAAGQSAIHRSAGGKRCTGSDEGTKLEEISSGKSHISPRRIKHVKVKVQMGLVASRAVSN